MSEVKSCDIAALNLQGSGPQWGEASDDLNITLLSWEEGRGVAWSVNNELDVVVVVVQGEGEAKVEDEVVPLKPGCSLLIPKSAHRSITSRSARLEYYSIHRRRAGLMPR